jgi:NTE family protein
MDNSEQTLASDAERLHVELRRLEWAKDLNHKTLAAITNVADRVEFKAGEMLIDLESEISHVYFLITGRLQATLCDSLGKEIQQDTLVRGSVVGLFSLGLSDRSHLQVQAAEPSAAIRLTR